MLISQETRRRIKIKSGGLQKEGYQLPLQPSSLIQSEFVNSIRSRRQHFLYFLHVGKNPRHSNYLTSKHSDEDEYATFCSYVSGKSVLVQYVHSPK